MRETLHGRALERAAELLGGEDGLAPYLQVSSLRLGLYLRGTLLCPPQVSRKVVQLLMENDFSAIEWRRPHQAPAAAGKSGR